MKVIVTHHSPDLDAITSTWLIKRFLPGWEAAKIRFVPAGERIQRLVSQRSASSSKKQLNPIEIINGNEIIHVDTGLGPLDHHQTVSDSVSAASLTFDFVKRSINNQPASAGATAGGQLTTNKDKTEAIDRIVRIVVDIDHFKEALWSDPTADYYEFSLIGILEGFRNEFPGKDALHVSFIIKCLDALLHNFENRIWAEREIKNGIKFKVGKEAGIGFETINDGVLPLAQKAGFSIVLRKDPRKGYVRIKVRPDKDFDLTTIYQKLKKEDPNASWFLHISKKMLLNGTAKNPKMKATKLSLKEIIAVLENM